MSVPRNASEIFWPIESSAANSGFWEDTPLGAIINSVMCLLMESGINLSLVDCDGLFGWSYIGEGRISQWIDC